MIRNALDPLLERLSRDYCDDKDLSHRLDKLFHVPPHHPTPTPTRAHTRTHSGITRADTGQIMVRYWSNPGQLLVIQTT